MTLRNDANTWVNWAGSAACSPARFIKPWSVDEVSEVVLWAAERGLSVRAVGAGHSFTPIVATDGVLLNLDLLSSVGRAVALHEPDRVLPRATHTITVGAGIRLRDLNAHLTARGFALANLGDIDAQSIAGAISTGTHGTGGPVAGISAQVRGVELDDLTGLTGFTGTPGAPTHAGPPNAVVGQHFEFYWFPHTRRTLTKRNTRTTHDDAPLHPARAWFDDELLSNNAFEVINRLAARAPRTTTVLNRVSARALSAREYTGAWHEVFVTSRRVRFRESAWAIPYAAMPDVLREIDAWINRSGARIAFPVEVRFAAPEDLWLSTAYGRASAYVAVHQFHRVAHQDYFAAVQDIMRAYDGRPHWGKLHTLDASYFAQHYPRLPDFNRVRAEHDPNGLFLNPYTRRVLGV